jgi:hypothetical protein
MSIDRRTRSLGVFTRTALSTLLIIVTTAAAEAASGTAENLFKRGFDELSAKQYSAAEADFVAGLKSRNDPQAWFYLGEAYRQDGKLDKAREAYNKSLLIDSNSPVAATAREQLAGNGKVSAESVGQTSKPVSPPPPSQPPVAKSVRLTAYCPLPETRTIDGVDWNINYVISIEASDGNVDATHLLIIQVVGQKTGAKGRFERKGFFDSTTVFVMPPETRYVGAWKIHASGGPESGGFTVEDGTLEYSNLREGDDVGRRDFQAEVNQKVHKLYEPLTWSIKNKELKIEHAPCELKYGRY